MYKLTDIYRQIKEEEAALPIQQYKIYCDMDGVLCDFDRQFEQYAKMSPKTFESKFGTDKFWELIDKIGYIFWSKMSWMSDGKSLWEYINKYKPDLLSAPSKKASSRYGKRLWVSENVPGAKLILADRERKQNYSKKNSILIDDRSDTISEWNSRGGIGILFTSTEQTINDLKKLGL
jgi:FMN phosphatase YigB (HAD superfamily)